MKIVTIIGARPQFIKAATISRLIAERKDITEIIIHTGQHFDENMSEVFFRQMNIPEPNYNLNINSLSHAAMTGQMMEKIEEILILEKPDWVLVYGDTNSTLAGSLAAKKLHIKIAHVEAGLRSFNMKMPEEINRILTDRISDILFCPTDTAVKNLKNEGFENFKTKIVKNGDVMQDAAIYYKDLAKKPNFEIPASFILASIHRPENTDFKDRMESIFKALEVINNEIKIVLPLHPRTRKIMNQYGFDFKKSDIQFVEPVGYLEMVYLLTHCKTVITDSGGMQKEAFFFEKPGLTLREESEWVELTNYGFNIICGADYQFILKSYDQIKNKLHNYNIDIFGNGHAAIKVLDTLSNYQ